MLLIWMYCLVTIGTRHFHPPAGTLDMTRGVLASVNEDAPGAYFPHSRSGTSPRMSLFVGPRETYVVDMDVLPGHDRHPALSSTGGHP